MTPCRTLDDVVTGFTELERGFRVRRDRRAIFLTLYGVVSAEMRDSISAGAFADPAWVERYAVAFANLYLEALEAHEAGRAADVPKAWRICFDAAAAGRGLVLQDVLLGVNAHVNNDLAFALDRVSVDPDRERRLRDHNAVNQVLSGVTERATTRLASLYAPGLATMDDAAGQVDEIVARLSLGVARDRAWEAACDLADGRGIVRRSLTVAHVSSRAAALARLILLPSRKPTLIAACRRLEEESNWLTLLHDLGQRQTAPRGS